MDDILIGQGKDSITLKITPRLVCGDCKLDYDCEYNLLKHREIVHLSFLD